MKMGKIYKKEIAAIIADKFDLDRRQSQNFVTSLVNVILEGLEDDHVVKIKGLGTFKVVDVEPRESVNVNTGERLVIDGHLKLSFIPDSIMKDLVNRPFSQFETVLLNDGVDFDDYDSSKLEDLIEPEVEKETNDQFDSATEDKSTSDNKSENELTEESAPLPPEMPDLEDKEDVADLTLGNSATEEPIPEIAEEVDNDVIQDFIVDDNIQKDEDAPSFGIVETESQNDLDDLEYTEPDNQTEHLQERSSPEELSEVEEEPYRRYTNEIKIGAEEEENTNNMQVEDGDEDDESPKRRKWWLWGIILLIIIAGLGLLAFFLLNKDKEEPKSQETVVKETVVEQPVNIPDSTTMTHASEIKEEQVPEKVEKEPEVPEWQKYNEMDPRTRNGSYYIMGFDRMEKIRQGDNTKRIASRVFGGAEMACYIEVYNGINASTPLEPGKEIKIPKIQTKKSVNKKIKEQNNQ